MSNLTEKTILAGSIKRKIIYDNYLFEQSLVVDGKELLKEKNEALSFSFSKLKPKHKLKKLNADESKAIESTASFNFGTDSLNIDGETISENESDDWSDKIEFNSCNITFCDITEKELNESLISEITLTASHNLFDGIVTVKLFYQSFKKFPVIRKWTEIINNSSDTIKIEDLLIEKSTFKDDFLNRIELTPSGYGAQSSIIAYENKNSAIGVIECSEIPSALRKMTDDGNMGYSDEYFEWVLSPNEKFDSEAVFLYAFSGEVYDTITEKSKPLDRTIESDFKLFLEKHMNLAANLDDIPAPIWCTWTNFGPNVDESSICEQADLAAKGGFKTLLIDDGWQRGRLGTEPDKNKFPDFKNTCKYITSKGLRLGLWVSSYRDMESKDLKDIEDGRIVPLVKRLDGYAMSFCSPWKNYYANDLADFKSNYNATYIKQDFTNIKFGDLAKGHYSKTRKESLLNGLRGLLESQSLIAKKSPEIWNELTHEIYWGTPGVPCDIAVLKHAKSYHIPPNDYSGVGHWKERYSENWEYDPDEMKKQLIQGCFNARQRLYEHRGLPMYCIEYYGASTVSIGGNLTPEIQDRQICSWLLGVPYIFAGDLSSLTNEQLNHYKNRFNMLENLQKKYSIYKYFNYSGVPSPTDTDWHWWGKLNEQGHGIVVVIRGSDGANKRNINIPWVSADKTYKFRKLLNSSETGIFSGKELINGSLQISLPKYGQEIIEIYE